MTSHSDVYNHVFYPAWGQAPPEMKGSRCAVRGCGKEARFAVTREMKSERGSKYAILGYCAEDYGRRPCGK